MPPGGAGGALIGQAVEAARAAEADHLRIALPKRNPYQRFFLDYGFVIAGENHEGRLLFEKDIRFDVASKDT